MHLFLEQPLLVSPSRPRTLLLWAALLSSSPHLPRSLCSVTHHDKTPCTAVHNPSTTALVRHQPTISPIITLRFSVALLRCAPLSSLFLPAKHRLPGAPPPNIAVCGGLPPMPAKALALNKIAFAWLHLKTSLHRFPKLHRSHVYICARKTLLGMFCQRIIGGIARKLFGIEALGDVAMGAEHNEDDNRWRKRTNNWELARNWTTTTDDARRLVWIFCSWMIFFFVDLAVHEPAMPAYGANSFSVLFCRSRCIPDLILDGSNILLRPYFCIFLRRLAHIHCHISLSLALNKAWLPPLFFSPLATSTN